MSKLRYRLGLFFAGLLVAFWSGYAILSLPAVRWARLLTQQRQVSYYSRNWESAPDWLAHREAARLILDPAVVDNRRQVLGSRQSSSDPQEWLLVYLGYRLQGLGNEQIGQLPYGSLVIGGALAGEAEPLPELTTLAASLSARPQGTFRLGLLKGDEFRLCRESTPQLQELKLYSMLRHDLDWSEAERVKCLTDLRDRQTGHNALCLQAAIELRAHLLDTLKVDYPLGTRLALRVTPPGRTGSRLQLHLKLLCEDFFRSLGYAIDHARGKPLPVVLELRLSNFDQLGIQERRAETSTTRRAVRRYRYSKYGSGAYTDYENHSESKIVVDQKVRSASIPTLWLTFLGQELALPPYGEIDLSDLERIQRLYAAKTVEPQEWFYWDYNIRVRASAPWRYGLDDFRRLTY